MTECPNCKIIHNNPKFCSRSCSVSYNNKLNPKRKPESECVTCKTPILHKHKYCKICIKNVRACRGDVTLKDAIYYKHHKSSAYALVRSRARKVIRDLNITSCESCGYDKHIEACHIKPINSFDEETKLSIINQPSNLLGLCPNCHWEFDNQLLSIQALREGVEPT